MTPHDGLNPAYRIYYTDSYTDNATHLVLDHATYSLDLNTANTDNTSISYTLEYTARESLGMQDLSPASWDLYVSHLVNNEQDWEIFYKRYSRGGPHASKHCGRQCKEDILCRLVTFDREDTSKCTMIKEQIRKVHNEKPGDEWSVWNFI